MFCNKSERLSNVIDIMKKLKNFKGKNGELIDLYNNNLCSFIEEFKKICNQYIEQDDMNVKDFKGTLPFDEVGRTIEYNLPAKKYKTPLFVMKANK